MPIVGPGHRRTRTYLRSVERSWLGAAFALTMALLFLGAFSPPGAVSVLDRFRLWLMEDDYRARVPLDVENLLDRKYDGSLYEAWRDMKERSDARKAHYGVEKLVVKGFRGTAFQVPTCAPSSFAGAVGHGKGAMKCVERDPVYTPISNLVSDSNGSNGIGPGTFGSLKRCLRATQGARMCVPEIEGTHAQDAGDFESLVLMLTDTGGGGVNFDSLVFLGYLPGAADVTERYDIRAGSYSTAGANPMFRLNLNQVLWGYTTLWDQECTGTGGDCTPDENKPFRACVQESKDSVYIYRSSFHGNSGDDIATIGCSQMTVHEVLFGPAQRGGTQQTCLTTRAYMRQYSVYRSGCFNAGNRTPEAKGTGEFAEWYISGWVGRNFELVDTASIAWYSGLTVVGKPTGGQNESRWYKVRPNMSQDPPSNLGKLIENGHVKIYADQIATDTTWNDGWNMNQDTYSRGGGSTLTSFYSNPKPMACAESSGEEPFPCTDTAGNQIDTTDFKSAVPFADSSDLIQIYEPPDSIWQRLIVRKEVGARFVVACDGTYTTAHNAFADSLLNMERTQTWPASVPSGSAPDSMVDWHPDYPTRAVNSGSTYTACSKNSNDVWQDLADSLATVYGGTAASKDWGNDEDGDGYELWREVFGLTSPFVYNNPDGSTGAATPNWTYVLSVNRDSTTVFQAALDTIFGALMVDTVAVPFTVRHNVCPRAAKDTALVAVRRGDQGAATVLDSAQVDSVLTAQTHEDCDRETLRQPIPN